MSLRQQQMDERRKRILDAAASLIRHTGGTDFSMRTLADVAATSPATPYNLFTSKDGLLYALLSRSLDEIERRGLAFNARDPLARVLEAAAKTAGIFLDDQAFLRPRYQFLLGVADPIHRPRFIQRSLAWWRAALAAADDAQLLGAEFDRDTLAYTLMAQFMGGLEQWIHADIDDDEFRAHISYAIGLQLWPLASGVRLERLRRHLRAARAGLPSANFQHRRDDAIPSNKAQPIKGRIPA